MQRRITVRPAHASADNDEIARIVSAVHPDRQRTGAEIAAAARRRGQRFHQKFVAEVAPGQLAGFGFLEVPDVAATRGRFRVRVTVDPSRIGLGIGAALYETIEAEARLHGATELCSEMLASQPRAQRFAFDRGFIVYNRRIESRLKVRDIDPERIARDIDAAADRFFDTGLRIASYRQLALGEEAPRRLYELFVELWRDVPFGIRGDDPKYESFVAEELGDPAFRSAGTFIALDGSHWVGMCAQCTGRDHLLTSMTGVVRCWRRHGLARWLKLHSIRHALESEVSEMRTYNDEANTDMLALNRTLGFVPTEIDLRLKKELR